MWGESPPQVNSGRDRAIETLIDMEPHGAFYRAARALDEAVPYALLNRPNLVTRAALVEQANALAENEIDTIEKFEQVFACTIPKTDKPEQQRHSEECRDRILRHHAKIVKVQRVHDGSSSSSSSHAAAPPPQLVSALRRVMEDPKTDSSHAALRSLLNYVMGHKAFKEEEEAEEEEKTEESDNKESHDDDDVELPAANFESIVGNVCKVAVSDNGSNSRDILDGYLIAILSILTGSMMEDEEETSAPTDSPKTNIVDGHKMAATDKPSHVDSLKPMMPALQVGGVLSLLPTETKDDDDGNKFLLDSDIMSYLGKAASVYEERIEIQKLRVLARMQEESEREAASKEAAAMAEEETSAQDASSDIPFAPVTPPPSGDASEAAAHGDRDGQDADGVARVEDDDVAPSDEGLVDRNGMFSSRIVSQVSEDETSSADDPEETALRLASIRDGEDDDSSDGDSTNSDDDNGSTSFVGYEEAQEAENPQSALLSSRDESVEIHEDDDVSSSSSSSSDRADNEVVDEEAMLVNDAIDSDEEEDDMLRQALALSLVEHSAASARNVAGEVDNEGADGNRGGDGEEAGEDDEQEKVPSVRKSVTSSASHEGQSDAETETKESAADENDDTLPSLPDTPSHYPYHSWLRRATIDGADFSASQNEDVARGGANETSASYLDPSALSKFGTLPAAHVIVHLLHNAVVAIQGRETSRGKEAKEGEKVTTGDNCPINSVPGGIGSSLFVPCPLSYDLEPSKRTEKGDELPNNQVSIQLLVSALVLFADRRNHAIESLRQAILLEHQNRVDPNIEAELKEEADGGRTPTSDEEDDPAIALAMNYASSPMAGSYSASESLETKGMKRKAAAAAHDAALLLKSLRKRTEAWKQRVQLHSHCTLMVLQCLRTYLQSITRSWLNLRSLPDSDHSYHSLVDCSGSLPATARTKLSDALSALMSIDSFRSFSALFSHDNANEAEELFLPLKLYREAVLVWGECVPLLYTSTTARASILTTLLSKIFPDSGEAVTAYEKLDSLRALPSSEWESTLHQLRLLCQRLCVSDLLDCFVSQPVSYDPDDSEDAHEIVKLRDEGGRAAHDPDPERVSNIVSLLGTASLRLEGCAGVDLSRLHLGLCHKCNVRTLFWDGFLASSNDNSDDRLASSGPSSAMSTGDILRVAANPSNSLQFDASKCSDSIAVLANHRNSSSSANGSSAHQRASKVWGTVLSSTCFNPKTGIHRWAVRLDRCERGHVFVGVSTAQASMRTYVGGDKYGWGVIGTQALWHDRRKIRGDYGAMFRTGSTIVVTLDTDAGTLSFSSWKDSNNSSASFSVDALIPSLSSPSPSRRHPPGGGGIVEDWGVAFEGLPLDSRLFPAVGLYQRDDRVTLLTVESGGRSSLRDGVVDGMVTGGACFYPKNLRSVGRGLDGVSHHRRIVHVRRHNDLLSWDGVQYVTDTLHKALHSLQSPDGADDVLLTSVLPSIAASLCLMPPSIPVLSARTALALLPQLGQCIRVLDTIVVSQNKQKQQLFPKCLRGGKWIIRATGSSGTLAGNECEEYVVSLTGTRNDDDVLIGFQGTGVGTTGKSKNGLVSIMGTVRGSAMCFVEEWTDGTVSSSVAEDSSSSCVISARLSLDGTKFEGSYRNVQYGTTGRIAGFLSSENQIASGPQTQVVGSSKRTMYDQVTCCQALFCMAHGHLAGLLGSDISGNHAHGIEASRPEGYDVSEWKEKCSALKGIVLRPLFSQGPSDPSSYDILESLRRCYSFPLHGGAAIARGDYRALDALDATLSSAPLRESSTKVLPAPTKEVAMFDDELTALTGGRGSLCSVCPAQYTASRRHLICALVYHSNLHDRLIQHCQEHMPGDALGDDVLALWRGALRIMENGMRNALAKNRDRARREVALEYCKFTDRKSSFLYLVQSSPNELTVSDLISEFSSFYSIVECETDLEYIEEEVDSAVRRAVLRMASLQKMKSLITGIQSVAALECCVVALPRLLGRGLAEVAATTSPSTDWGRRGNDDLGGYYLTHLSASGQIAEDVRGTARSLFLYLGDLLGKVLKQGKTAAHDDSFLSNSSLILAVLATFTTTIRSTDVDDIVLQSEILHHIADMMSIHREAIRKNGSKLHVDDDHDNGSAVQETHKAVSCDVTRAVLRASVSLLHVIGFQLARQSAFPSKIDRGSGNNVERALQMCVKLLRGEIEQTIPLIGTLMRDELEGYRLQQADDQWRRWCDVCRPGDESQTSRPREKKKHNGRANSGLLYLLEQGTFSSSAGVAAGSQKLSSRPTAPASSVSSLPSERLLMLLGTSCHQHVSQLLHILSTMVKFPSSLSIINKSKRWRAVLLHGIGLVSLEGSQGHAQDVVFSQDGGIAQIPARYRVRILRLLLRVLSPSAPNRKLIEGFFVLVGSSTASIAAAEAHDDENSVSREVVSLLRHLHSLPSGSWRQCIHQVVDIGLSTPVGVGGPSDIQLGILAFLSGSVGNVCRGSFVLLKPAAALPLSSDTQSASSSKGHGGSGGGSSSGGGAMPHHIVGNGTEGVVAGLCRDDASAGIVSSVDVKNGTCEVILTTRHQVFSVTSDSLSQDHVRSGGSEASERGCGSTMYTMTVRALRAPLSDVVHAEEVPILEVAALPATSLLSPVLSSSLSSLSVAVSELKKVSEGEEEEKKVVMSSGTREDAEQTSSDNFDEGSQALQLCGSLMALRSAATVLSDEHQLSNFLKTPSTRQILASMLKLAHCDQSAKSFLPRVVELAQMENLSFLPSHEARFCHLVSMLREISFRQEVLSSTPSSYWEKREVEHDPETKETSSLEARKSPDGDTSTVTEVNSTPPPTTGSVAGAPLGHTTSAAGDECDRVSSDRDNASSSQQRASRASGGSNSTDDDDDDTDATAAAHLREAAIAQMAELGLPRPWSELALRRTGGTNIEAAVHFCLERGGDMDRLLAEERERERMMQRQTSATSGSRRRGNRGDSGGSNQLLRQLLEMGFPSRWCAEALAATRNNVDEALTWILTNGERLSAEDEGMDDDDDVDSDSGDEEDSGDDEPESGAAVETGTGGDSVEATSPDAQDAASQSSVDAAATQKKALESDLNTSDIATVAWSGSVTPLRFISGRSIINPETLEISGLPSGGFSSVGTKGVMLTSGKWYYEAILESAGCLQIGWADGSFAGHCNADRGDGCGDGPSSWAYDGWRRYRWHACATEWGCRWKEGDVVGCLVDMDEHVVSFTLNGRGEEIGMGVAFTGKGFRPCGGVYACVSFNRREKLRLILGGKAGEPFKHQPPSGYRGVGDAVLEAVDELDILLSKEAILDDHRLHDEIEGDEPPAKKFLCDFSDGEHGHELFAWQHRYYGSDASVHLGSGRSAKPSGANKHSVGDGAGQETATARCVSKRVEKQWSRIRENEQKTAGATKSPEDASAIVSKLKQGYNDVALQISLELLSESVAIGILYARKFILHLIVNTGADFDLAHFIGTEECQNMEAEEVEVARRLWSMLEACVSLRSAGWVGEAGAMAVAAEALGLGISSNDHHHHFRHRSSELARSASITGDNDELVVGGGITQFLSTALLSVGDSDDATNTASCLAACAEAALGGGGGGGPLVFLKRGLQSAICRSAPLRKLLIAVVRRSVRLLAVVHYAGNDSASDGLEDEDIDGTDASCDRSSRPKDGSEEDGDADESVLPDARLVCFLTGMLMSEPVLGSLGGDPNSVMVPLFEAWSIGLLSASSPWRMVCALTASGILNECPIALSAAVESLPTLGNFFSRLESTVVRRVWAERAASPVCSRFVQSMVELLASVKRASQIVSLVSLSSKSLTVDAATPLPLEALWSPARRKVRDDSASVGAPPTAWEWDQGWVSCDLGWELWSGTVECMAVEWKTPSRSAVRTLMDGGEGPPMLREGCHVMRGLDWDDAGSGSDLGTEDGKDTYETEKKQREKEKRSLEDDPAAGSASEGDTADDANRRQLDEASDPVVEDKPNPTEPTEAALPPNQDDDDSRGKEKHPASDGKKKKKKKLPSPKLPIGTVLSIESWRGIPAMARRVRWHLTGIEGVYRYGGDGGRYDLSHVEVNDKATRVRKRHPLPESAEQCASRHGFGAPRKYSVLLRLRRDGSPRPRIDGDVEFFHQGILEWPDFGAGVRVDCILHSDGAVTITERELLFGSKDSGWEARFGQPSYEPGTVIVLNPTGSSTLANQSDLDTKSAFLSFYEELLGSSSFTVAHLRNRADGGKLRVTSEMKLLRARRTGTASLEARSILPESVQAPMPPPMCFDHDFKASSLSLSRDGRTVSCISHDGRSTAFGSVGFTKGVHYWEVKLEQADIGSVFIGVAEKPSSASGSGSGGSSFGEVQPRLNRWLGWGFVNFRATYAAGAERVYGAHCHNGDTVGVLLDCDAGRVSFFVDQLKYGEHILNDLGCAFENVSPFGFNADGCGNGGAGQGAPSGVEGGRGSRYPAQGSVRPRSLWPVVGLRTPGDRVTISAKWMTSYGIDGVTALKNVLAVDEILCRYDEARDAPETTVPQQNRSQEGDARQDALASRSDFLPKWFVEEAFAEYRRWRQGRWYRTRTRGSGPHQLTSVGLDVDLDTSPLSCASACAALGLKYALLSGDRVVVKRSAGRMLELAEEAVVLGVYQGRLFYRIVAQKSEGGSLTEGGGRAWFWDESEVVDNGVQLVGDGKGLGIELPLLDRFKCTSSGGLKIVYEGGAVVRSDLEILDGSQSIGSIPFGTVIPQQDVLERRVNSCGVVRYRINFEAVGQGWISSRIRGGKEESIVNPICSDGASEDPPERRFQIPHDSATAWYTDYELQSGHKPDAAQEKEWLINDVDEFHALISEGRIKGLPVVQSDELVVAAVSAIADFSEFGDAVDCSFEDVVGAVSFAVASRNGGRQSDGGTPEANQAAAAAFSSVKTRLPSAKALLARIAMLRAFNRRARLALPWLSMRPGHEGSAIFGGLCGHGASIERAGRNTNIKATELWFQPTSVASRIRVSRRLFFCSVKRLLLDSITEATTTPTPLSHDEYELPREIRTVRVNRLKAIRAMAGDDNVAKRKHSVFSQLHNETRSWGGAALRRGFVAKGHGGQKRAFKLKLIGEGVNDYSGPYREAFTDAAQEVTALDSAGHGALGVLEPTPNNASDTGENRELFMFSTGEKALARHTRGSAKASKEELRIRESFASLTTARDESSRELEESLIFLGRMSGTACRHGIPVDLPLPLNTVWKALVEEASKYSERLKELDLIGYRQLGELNGITETPLLWWQQRMLNSLVEGMSNVLPVEIFPLFTGEELRDIICGNPEVDVDLLRRVVEYEGYNESDDVIRYFWETLREMSSKERKMFLQFVWARNRLPMKESDFDAPFKIQRDSANEGVNCDVALPSASTCFFSLTLPNYSSKEILKKKLHFAIQNVCTMESDYVTNDAEVGEGWRGL